MKRKVILSIVVSIIIIGGIVMLFFYKKGKTEKIYTNTISNYQYKDKGYVTADTTVSELLEIESIKEFSKYILPIKTRSGYENLTLDNINTLLPYHSHINTDTTLEIINYMIDEVNNGNQIFYDVLGNSDTGLFFFRGNENAPFAIICAGGGFSYVGSIHEAYPHALELSKMGYNAFVIEYTPDWEESNIELARAISYIFEHSEELKVSTDNYSLWGSSAGARMVANIGTYGVQYFGGNNVDKPAVVVTAYTGHSDYGDDEVPTIAFVGENDGIANPNVMENRINILKSMGVDAEIHKYSNLSHGFGLGIGTSAEGWINTAVEFWEKHINN